MSNKEKLVELEEYSKDLVANLEVLLREAKSYESAGEELSKVSEKLNIFINDTKNLSINALKVLDTMRTLSADAIVSSINTKIDNINSNLKKEIIINSDLCIEKISEKLNVIDSNINSEYLAIKDAVEKTKNENNKNTSNLVKEINSSKIFQIISLILGGVTAAGVFLIILKVILEII